MIALMIDVSNHSTQSIDISVSPRQEIGIEQDIINVLPVPVYKGEYEVTPKVTEQTLPTAQKVLEKDVCVKKIPYFEVSNNSGGNTVFIGSEV